MSFHRYTGKQRVAELNKARFAAALADPEINGNITKAAAKMGISQQRGSQLLAKIRKDLGWQAQ